MSGRKPSAYASTTEDNMRAALVLGVVATLALSAGVASAQAPNVPVYPRYGYAPHGYGYYNYAYGYHHRHYGYHHRYYGYHHRYYRY
jgi:hypothetical protein